MADQWQLKGNYFESCTCDIMCPCIFLKPPTKGYCKAIVGWQILKGSMNNVDLSNLNVGLYLHAPELMTKGGWKISLYIDDKASEEQKNALIKIYSGEVGGHPAVLASFIGEVVKVKSAKISLQYNESEKQMIIEDIAEVHIKAVKGMNGGHVTVNNEPLSIAPNFSSIVHETQSMTYNDVENHSHSGTVGIASPFSYQP